MRLPGGRAFQAEEQSVQRPCGISVLNKVEEAARRLPSLSGVSQGEESRRGRQR